MLKKIYLIILITWGTIMSNYIQSKDAKTVLKIPQIKTNSSIVLTGEGKSPLFSNALALPSLIQSEYRNSKKDLFSKIEIIGVGDWVLLNVEIEESGEIIARESLNGGTMWFDDNIQFIFSDKSKLSILCNPLGAVNINIDGKDLLTPIREGKFHNVTRINNNGWRLELAIHKSLIPQADGISNLQIIRERQNRGYQGFKKYEIEIPISLEGISGIDQAVLCEGRQNFNDLNIVQGCYVNQIPSNKEEWLKLPALALKPFHGGLPIDVDFQKTEVRIAVNDSEIAIFIINFENNMDQLHVATKTSSLSDENEIFLGPDGFNYVQVVVDSKDSVKANKGKTGGKGVSGMPTPKSLVITREQDAKSWSILSKISVQEILEFSQAPITHTPKTAPWRIQVIRTRPAKIDLGQKNQESILVATGSSTAHAPLRFARLNLVNAAEIIPVKLADIDLPKPVISSEMQKDYLPSLQVSKWIDSRKAASLKTLNDEISKISSLEEWEVYKADKKSKILKSIFPASNGMIPGKSDLREKIIYQMEVSDVKISGLIFMSRVGLPVTVTLYEPKENSSKNKPCLILVPAHHTSRNSNDLYIVAKNICDQGGVAIAFDSIGSGERGLAPRWNHINQQRNLVGAQVKLAGEEILGWTIADLMSTVDYLYARKDIDPARIGIVGGVAGGGDYTALAAAIDERISLSVPFNFSNNVLVDGWYDFIRSYPGSIADGVSPWLVCALNAPRHYIMAEEFAWSDKKTELLNLTRKIYSFYGKTDHVDSLHGWEESHATHYNYMHRIPMYTIINRWWGLKLPEKKEDEKLLKLKDSHLEIIKAEASENYFSNFISVPKKSMVDFKDRDLELFNRSAGNNYIKNPSTAELFNEPHLVMLDKIIQERKKTDKKLIESNFLLKSTLEKILINTNPTSNKPLKIAENKWHEYSIENIWLPLEDGLVSKTDPSATIWLIKPKNADKPSNIIVCVAQEGKAAFLIHRKSEIFSLLEIGVCVVLVDLRSSGETEPTPFRLPESIATEQAIDLWQMKESLIGSRVKDLRSILSMLSKRSDLDVSKGLCLWGEGFTSPNGKHEDAFRFEETGFRQVSPEGKSLVEAMGTTVCLMTALLTNEVKINAIVGRGGLISYESILHDRYHYIPQDIIIPGFIKIMDLPLIMQSLEKEGVNLYLEDMRDGKNRVMSKESLEKLLPSKALGRYSNAAQFNLNSLFN